MHGITKTLLGGALGVLGLLIAPTASSSAPDPQAEIAACQKRCDASESETDRATCRLNCRQAVEEKDRAHIIRWTEERSVGGRVPGQGEAPPPKRTVTKVTPRGTTTQTQPSPRAKKKAPPTAVTSDTTQLPSPRHRYYFGLVACQDQCNSHKMGGDRARCKLRCFRQHPGPPPPRSTPLTRKTGGAGKAGSPKAKTSPKRAAAKKKTPATNGRVECQAQCADETTEDDRMTCEAQCWNAKQRKAKPTTQRTTQVKTESVKVSPADCRRRCQGQATSCRQGCEGKLDEDTCRLQCTQAGKSCERRCG